MLIENRILPTNVGPKVYWFARPRPTSRSCRDSVKFKPFDTRCEVDLLSSRGIELSQTLAGTRGCETTNAGIALTPQVS